MKRKKIFSVGGLLAGFLLAAIPAAADLHYVSVNHAHFSPALLTIAAGETVEWENTDVSDSSHTTTSNLGIFNPNYWEGYLVSYGDTFDLVFNNVGTFTYHDAFDGFTGTIIVTAPAPLGIVLAAPRTAGNQFYFDATGLTVGKTNVLQASTNLTSWVAIKTNVANNAAMSFTNTMTLPKRFFRLLEQP